jgi:hypothetical protein
VLFLRLSRFTLPNAVDFEQVSIFRLGHGGYKMGLSYYLNERSKTEFNANLILWLETTRKVIHSSVLNWIITLDRGRCGMS